MASQNSPTAPPPAARKHLHEMAEMVRQGHRAVMLYVIQCANPVCTSINHVVCHGIPNDKPLRDGDIVNIDVTLIVDGWHGDTSRMYRRRGLARRPSGWSRSPMNA
jgi:methionine aminopeptidase